MLCNPKRREVVVASSAVLFASAMPTLSRAQAAGVVDNLRIVYGFPAGSAGDSVGRRVAEKIKGEYARVSAVVENKPGAGGRIAVDTVKPAAPDGQTLLLTPHSMLSVYPHIYAKLSYNALEDVIPVSLGATFSHGLAVGPKVPAEVKNVKEFVAWCKANPKDASFGSPGAGSTPHFMGAMIEKSTGVEIKHVPYRGSVPGVADVLGGQIAAMCTPIGDFIQHAKAGKMRILASSGATRTRFTPDVPTMTESGFPNIAFEEWFAFFAPKGTPAAVVNAASAAINKALGLADVKEGLANLGLEAVGSSPGDLGRMLKAEYDRWGPIVKAIGFTAES